jgi:hypothetical protein
MGTEVTERPADGLSLTNNIRCKAPVGLTGQAKRLQHSPGPNQSADLEAKAAVREFTLSSSQLQ